MLLTDDNWRDSRQFAHAMVRRFKVERLESRLGDLPPCLSKVREFPVERGNQASQFAASLRRNDRISGLPGLIDEGLETSRDCPRDAGAVRRTGQWSCRGEPARL